IIKTFEVAVFISLAFLITGYYVLSARDIVLFLFLIDFVTISISTDIERGSNKPEKWNISSLVKFSVTIGLFTVTELFILLYLAINYFNLGKDIDSLQTFFFTAIMFLGLLTPLIVREKSHFWKTMPGRTLLISIIFDMVLVSILSIFGFGIIKPITLDELIFIIIYVFAFSFLVNDNVKILLSKLGFSR
ncbi:MAG: plasma-membrane proton-efflux P-type ATPase, partial [Thermoplasmata archaeon]